MKFWACVAAISVMCILYFSWFGVSIPQIPSELFRGFVVELIDTLLLTFLVIATLYYARETKISRKLSEQEISERHFKDMKRELIEPWFRELEFVKFQINKILIFGVEKEIIFSFPSWIEKNRRFTPFFSHFPDQYPQWNNMQSKISEYNGEYSEFVKFINLQIEQECGLRMAEEWTGEIGQLNERAVLKIINNLIREDLGSTTEWRLSIERFETYYQLKDQQNGVGMGTRDQLEICQDIIYNNELSKNEENLERAKKLCKEIEAILADIDAFGDELQDIQVIPWFPNKCRLCPPSV